MESNRDRGGYDTLLIPRSYNDLTSNAQIQAYAEAAEVSNLASAASAEESAASATESAASAEAAATSEANAATSETNAAASATLAESWAVGGTETRDGEDTDNSKYYAEQASASADEAESVASETATSVATSVATETTTTLIADFEERVSSLEDGLSTQYAGTGSENNPVYFDEDGAAVACISDEYYNTFLGVDAGATLLSSIDEYLDDDTSVYYCRCNTAVGYQALTANTTGYYNTAVGYQALVANTTGGSNTAVGVSALAADTTGGSNTAVGWGALAADTTGGSNTAVGENALANNNGSYNVVIGQGAARHTYATTNGVTSVSYCTVIGAEPFNNSSSSNTWYDGRLTSGSLKGQLSYGFMKGLYFQAGTAYSTIYSAITDMLGASSSSGTAYGAGCAGSYGIAYNIRSICYYSSTVYLYSGSGGTVLSITSSSSTIAYGLKLWFPVARTSRYY